MLVHMRDASFLKWRSDNRGGEKTRREREGRNLNLCGNLQHLSNGNAERRIEISKAADPDELLSRRGSTCRRPRHARDG